MLLFTVNTGSVYFRVERMSCFASEISGKKSIAMCLPNQLVNTCIFETIISSDLK